MKRVTTTTHHSPMDGARRKGREAALSGQSPFDCPYPDKRHSDGRSTWCRAFRCAWYAGFTEVAQKDLFHVG